MKKKLDKSFKISYIVNVVLFLIVAFWLGNTLILNSGNLLKDLAIGFVYVGLYLLNFLISLINLIITLILGIKNYKKSVDKKTKNNIVIMLSILGSLHIIVLLFTIITIISA